MKPIIRFLLLPLFLFFPVTIVHAQASTELHHEIEGRGIASIPSGEASFTSSGTPGSVISFSRDFDFKNQLGFQLLYTYRSSTLKHKLVGDFNQTSWSRDTTLSRSFTFRGQTYVANLSASGDLRLRVFRGIYSYRWGNEKFRMGPMVDMGVISTRLTLTGATNNGVRTETGTISKFAATVGYDLDYNPTPRVNIFNNLGAIRFSGEHLFHVDGGVKFFLTHYLGVSGGYRAQRYRLEDNDNFVTIRTHGPFFGGLFRF